MNSMNKGTASTMEEELRRSMILEGDDVEESCPRLEWFEHSQPYKAPPMRVKLPNRTGTPELAKDHWIDSCATKKGYGELWFLVYH